MSARPVLTGVSDTAHWVAFLRALESERRDALFHDPYARKLAGGRGRLLAKRLPSTRLGWPLAVRTRVFDDFILAAIRERRVRTVVNLAAGFDARPYRLPLQAELTWIEVDLPAIIDAKTACLSTETPRCGIERVALDLTDRSARRALFRRLHRKDEPILVITEGLLVYLAEADVVSLADDIRDTLGNVIWLLENVSPGVLQRQRRLWASQLNSPQSGLRFAPNGGWEFFRALGWELSAPTMMFDEARRLRREPLALSLLRRLSPSRYDRRRKSVQYMVIESPNHPHIAPHHEGDDAQGHAARPA
jgi:methyltransferase (TIGR00027 family)